MTHNVTLNSLFQKILLNCQLFCLCHFTRQLQENTCLISCIPCFSCRQPKPFYNHLPSDCLPVQGARSHLMQWLIVNYSQQCPNSSLLQDLSPVICGISYTAIAFCDSQPISSRLSQWDLCSNRHDNHYRRWCNGHYTCTQEKERQKRGGRRNLKAVMPCQSLKSSNLSLLISSETAGILPIICQTEYMKLGCFFS